MVCGWVCFHFVNGIQDGLVVRPYDDICARIYCHIVVYCFIYGKQLFGVYWP